MTPEEIQSWILDTLSEGGYSFKELRDYIFRNTDKENDFLDSVYKLCKSNFIRIYVSTPHDESKIYLDADNQMATLNNYNSVVMVESKIGTRHYFEVTEKGIMHLRNIQSNKLE